MDDHIPLRTAWTDSLARGARPDGTDLRAHLRAVHDQHAGFTEICAQACRDAQGRTSYQLLADHVPPDGDQTVLDLACGSGPLLDVLHSLDRGLTLVGVDMSGGELALAQRRLPQDAARLIEAEAHDIAELPDSSVDVVLCHWALTLMDPVRAVLDEARRLLAPGGRFVALVDGPMEAAPNYAAVHDLIYRHVGAECPGYGAIDLGDPRVRGASSLIDLVREAFPGADVTMRTHVLTMQGEAETVADAAAGFFYAAFVLSPARRKRMLAELTSLLSAKSARANGGQAARFDMPVNVLHVRV